MRRRCRPKLVLVLAGWLPAVLAGCGGGNDGAGENGVPAVPGADGGAGSGVAGEAYRVRFETTAGNFVVEVHPDWAPVGAARFREAVEQGAYDGARFFRVVPGFVVQWGIPADLRDAALWRDDTIPDERVVEGNTRGRITFAKGGPDSRTTQVFVNLGDNTRLDAMGFPAFGKVVEGMDVVEKINAEYLEEPDQERIQFEGEAYLAESFPRLDKIERAVIVEEETKDAPTTDDAPNAADAPPNDAPPDE